MSEPTLDYRQHLVLFVDDEQKTRKYFAKLFGKTFRIVLAEDGVAGLLALLLLPLPLFENKEV